MLNPFGRPQPNRRRGPRRTLEARGDVSDPAPSRRRPRWLAVTLLAAAAALLIGARAASNAARELWLNRISALALQRIQVSRDGVLTEDEIRRAAGVRLGQNALTLDLFEIRARLLRHARVADAVLRLDFPDTLRVEIHERIPVARAILPTPGDTGVACLLDRDGRIMPPLARESAPPGAFEAEEALPLVTGLSRASFNSGEAVADSQGRAALELLSSLDAAAPGCDLASVDVSAPGALLALTTRGEQIVFSPDGLPRQLRDWAAVEQRATALGRAIATLDLSVRNNAPLRWAIDSRPSDIRPRPQRPARRTSHPHA